MPDYKQLFGYAAILFGIGFIIQSIMPAVANPSGPSISFGGNPYRSEYRIGSGTLLNTSSTETFIITTIVTGDTDCHLQVNGNTKYSGSWSHVSQAIPPNLHLVIEPNSTVTINGTGCSSEYYINGYYAHP